MVVPVFFLDCHLQGSETCEAYALRCVALPTDLSASTSINGLSTYCKVCCYLFIKISVKSKQERLYKLFLKIGDNRDIKKRMVVLYCKLM